jgi:hypothetical protein
MSDRRLLAAAAALWLACSVPTIGWSYADFDCSFPALRTAASRHRDLLGVGVALSMWGPAGVIVTYVMSGFAYHGWSVTLGDCR